MTYRIMLLVELTKPEEIEGREVKCPLTLNNKVPLSRADFDKKITVKTKEEGEDIGRNRVQSKG